jgi:tRNA G37 N-methylase Trm5
LQPGGILHYYDMQAKGYSTASQAKVAAACLEQGRRMQLLGITRCGHCGPTVYRLCLDAVIDAAQ